MSEVAEPNGEPDEGTPPDADEGATTDVPADDAPAEGDDAEADASAPESANSDGMTTSDEDVFAQLASLAGKGELDESTLQAELQRYTQAYKEEFDAKLAESSEPADVARNTREFLRNNVSMCAAQIVHLAMHSTADSVRASCSKYVVDKVLEDVGDAHNPLNEIIESLRAK